MENALAGAAVAGLLVIDWVYGRRIVRAGTIAAAILLWLYAQPGYTVAARRASAASGERGSGAVASEDMRGVDNMRLAVLQQVKARAPMRHTAIGALAWLALSPLVRRKRTRGPP